MQYDFSRVDDVHSYVSIPEGRYVCRVTDVRESSARDGSQRWSFRLEVCEGEFAGRTAGWDSVTWSERGIHRVKLFLAALGFDVAGPLELEARELLGREVCASFLLEQREDPSTGVRQARLRVPYAGYQPIAEWRAEESVAGADTAVDGFVIEGNGGVDAPRSG